MVFVPTGDYPNDRFMSTSEEIAEVFAQDIEKRTRIVENSQGQLPFYDNFRGFNIFSLYDGLGIDKISCSDFKPRHD